MFQPLKILCLLKKLSELSYSLRVVPLEGLETRDWAMTEDRGERLQIMLSAEELKLLDTFRFDKRMPSRASAVRELLKRGLASGGFDEAAFGTKSSDYGVSGNDPSGRDGHG